MSQPAQNHQLSKSFKFLSPAVGLGISLWATGIVAFTTFAFNALENSAKTSTADIALLLRNTVENEEELLATRAKIIGDSKLIRSFINDSASEQNNAELGDIKKRHNLDFIQVYVPDTDQLLTTTLSDQDFTQNIAQINENLEFFGDVKSGFFVSDDNSEVFLMATARIEFSPWLKGYLSVGKKINERKLDSLKKNASLELALIKKGEVITSTLMEDDSMEFNLEQSEEEAFWQNVDDQDYLIKSLEFDSFNEKKVALVVLNPASVTENAESQLFILVALFCVLGVMALWMIIHWNRKAVRVLRERIKIITDATENLAEGESHALIEINSDDDFGRLARSFNLMTEKLSVREQELKDNVVLLKEALADLKQTQNQIVQSEKMAALGQMVAGIAHEINNPLSFISGNLPHVQDYGRELLKAIAVYEQGDVEADSHELDIEFIREDLPKAIASIKNGVSRIQVILKSLRTFSRLDESEYKEVDLHESIDSVLLILQHRLRMADVYPEIRVKKNYGELPLIECFAGELNQVFLQILNNAIDAIHDKYQGVPMTVMDVFSDEISIETTLIGDDYIQVAIANSGKPLTLETRAHLFEPFFSTKPIGKGAGLGLAISYQIITEIHRGEIWCDFNEQQQTAFYFVIPVKQLSNA